MTSPTMPLAEPAGIITHYETLRRAALGEALPPAARAGLMLFRRRGMWGWARAVATPSAWPPPAGARPSTEPRSAASRTLIHLLAALASQATS